MTAHEFLSDLKSRGIDVVAVGDRLRVTAPVGTVTPALRERIQAHKPELLALLMPESSSAQAGTADPPSHFRFVSDHMDFGDICAGWTPAAWAEELRRKAERCDQYRPDIADHYRLWATNIEQRLPRRNGTANSRRGSDAV